MSIFRQLFTGVDGLTHDVGRWSWAVCLFGVIGAALLNWFHGVAVDIEALARAFGVVTGVHGAALWAKKDTEPKP